MELFFLLSVQVVPAVIYLVFCYLLQRYPSDAYESVGIRHNVESDAADVNFFSVLFVIIALGLISDAVYMAVMDSADEVYLQSLSVSKVYIFSSLLPYIMMKYLVNIFRYAWCLYSAVCLVAVSVFLINHCLVAFCAADECTVVLWRIAMLSCIAMLVVFMFLYLFGKEWNSDLSLCRMNQDLRLYGCYFAGITAIFVFYAMICDGVWDYLLVMIAFLAVHALLVYNKIRKRHSKSSTSYPVREESVDELYVLEDEDSPDENVIYKSSIEVLSVEQMKAKIVKYFEVEKGFLHPDLNLEMMAHEIGTNKTYLSYVINKDMNKKFRDLVKYYRVKEAIRIFNENPQISYKDLSRMCGFKNFASFTGAFKLYTGMPPGEWCRSSKKNICQPSKKSK